METITDIQEVMHVLLAHGKAKIDKSIRLVDINKFIKTLDYKAMRWPNSSYIYLINSNCDLDADIKYKIVQPWTDAKVDAFKKLFEAIAKNDQRENVFLNFFTELDYINYDKGRVSFTKRTLLNFSETLIEMNPEKYHLCDVCGIISEGERRHGVCHEIVEKE